ncbi:MAG: Abi-alpha family protein [Syntrophomonas sp.]
MSNDASKGLIIGDLTGAGQVINSEVAKQTYNDALSPTMRELGGLSVDTFKAFRLFTAPIQLMAAYQDRFRVFCDKVRNKVPEEHQREAPAEIGRPVMEAFASTSDDSPLMAMFEELMAKAIDKREADKLSPSFPEIIRTLSPLEAKLIAALKKMSQITDDIFKTDENLIVQRIYANFNFADFGDHAHHLTISQDLMEKKIVSINHNISIDATKLYPLLVIPAGCRLKRTKIDLTMFGKWFASACVGDDNLVERTK